MKKTLNFLILSISLIVFYSCSESETNDAISTENVTLKNKEAQSIYVTKANRALLYTLVYVHDSIDEETDMVELINSAEVISGNEIFERIEMNAQPYSDEELEYVTEILENENSRAILISDVYNPKTQKRGDVVFLSYFKNVETPEHLDNKDGIFLFGNGIMEIQDDETATCYSGMSGFDCMSCNWFSCKPGTPSYCYQCPKIFDDYRNLLNKLRIPLEYVDLFKNILLFSDIKLGVPIVEQHF